MKTESSGAGATLMKTKSSGAGVGAMFMKGRSPEPELYHFYDGSGALEMTNDMVAMAVNWQKRMRPKMQKER